MKTYIGQAPHRVIVQLANGKVRELDLALAVRSHSPTGFSWGYGGSGPAQLALAICIDCVGRHRALEVYQAFKWDVIAKLPGDRDWELTETQIRAQIEDYERELARAGTVRA
jgi:hypothetical protein